MPARKLTADMQEAVDTLHATHLRLVHDRAVLRAKIEAQLRDELASLEDDRSAAARTCQALGVPKSVMLEAIGTSSYNTIYAILDHSTHTSNVVTGTALDNIEFQDGRWLVTSPDGCTMPLNESGRGYAIEYTPGPEGREWDEQPILPTPAWEAWYEKNADLIAEHVRAA